ncbi:MAG: type IV secretion system DNA-binding domain-containing protein [Candidatus Thiodiazotropha sp.]
MLAPEIELKLFNLFGYLSDSFLYWSNDYWCTTWAALFFTGNLFGMSPLLKNHQQSFNQIVFVYIRQLVLYTSMLMLFIPLLVLYVYDIAMDKSLITSHPEIFAYFLNLLKKDGYLIPLGALLGFTIRLFIRRYLLPLCSAILRKIRHVQTSDEITDIRSESERYKVRDYSPNKFYKEGKLFIGLDDDQHAIYVPDSTWYETNMQLVGPTRYGKGVILGVLMDQIIKKGDALFYVDPKKDKFAPHVMKQACDDAGREFHYICLHDEGIGKWAPFVGGKERDSLARIESAFNLGFTGNPGSDYYKTLEKKALKTVFSSNKNIIPLRNAMANLEASQINAELEQWSSINSLCPNDGEGFSIESALKNNAVVYVQGSLDDPVIKTATKTFIIELIQESRRLANERKNHLTAIIDEVSFLTSTSLSQALATAVGFRVNFVLAYQSQNDLMNIDDKTVNAGYVYQSINVNTQIKAVYGGADYETAKWLANLSGTITKEVTKLERANISSVGGETWEDNRMIGKESENYINTNTILTLPPRVCIFIQPRNLAKICYPSFVKVRDMNMLETHICEHAEEINNKEIEQEPVEDFLDAQESNYSDFNIHTLLDETQDKPK